MTRQLLLFVFLFSCTAISAQETFPVNGVHDKRHTVHAFTNAVIYVNPDRRMDSATLIIQDGKVVEVAKGRKPPKNAVVHDCKGKVIYPSFIDANSGLNVEKKKPSDKEQKTVEAGNWNPAIHPEYSYSQSFPVDKKKSEDWLSSGFAVVNLHERDGIMRGASQLIVLGQEEANEAVLKNKASDHYSFSKGSSKNDYPSSFMGAIALIRQTFYDAQWYANGGKQKEMNPSLEALAQVSRPQIFELNHSQSVRNIQALGQEFQRNFIMIGAGKEYSVIDEVSGGAQFVLPMNYPNAMDVSDPYMARMASLDDLKHWELAPFNARILNERGINFSLSRDTLRSAKDFWSNLKKTTDAGLNHEKALDALTRKPAAMLNVSDKVGTLEAGKQANFFVANKTFVEEGFRVEQHWTKGESAYQTKSSYDAMVGTYNLVINKVDYKVTVKSADEKGVKADITNGGTKLNIKIEREVDLISVQITTNDSTPKVMYRLSGKITLNGGVWDGKGHDEDGNWITWAAIKDRKSEQVKKTKPEPAKIPEVPKMSHPNMAYGWDSLVNERTFVITNVVVWTASDTGTLKRGDVLVEDGKIKSVGANSLFDSSIKRINGNGMHLTPGIIDEHSHIGIRGGVNEWAQASSAEVRIGDAVDPWNINIYRQLVGGVTTAQLLHGSANPIGGQSAIVKLKWGQSADEMLIDDAPGFIKFALGENVKRSHSRDPKGRFPLTRMGVEQSFADAFIRAGEYSSLASAQQNNGKRKKETTSVSLNKRRDLELDAISEILQGQRHITCHSYVQSEILMLMNLADSLGFKVNTFTHILEGYKVSGEMKEHGVSASTFSDWWAYKYEVNDAIPYNAAMLYKAGVNTGINSDDAEMGRRLNQEAAKAIKYGGLSEEEAIKLVTINPAKMLHLDHRIGSIEVGKDADLVLWSGNPLSVYSHVEKTWIEGMLYYDAHKQDAIAAAMQKERARLIQKMLQDGSENKSKPKAKEEKHMHCDTLLENYLEE
ncbi:MAG: amidohydrolase family protein [Flavobacteriales bacterium]